LRRSIGIYGGTFDPVHNGHLQVAEAILNAFALDRLVFVPAYAPPHKRKQTISSPFHRMSMLTLATANSDKIFVSTIELEAPSRPYTIETLGRLQAELDPVRLFFIMGADSFRDVTSWRSYERILSEFDVIVATRPGYDTESSTESRPAADNPRPAEGAVAAESAGPKRSTEDSIEGLPERSPAGASSRSTEAAGIHAHERGWLAPSLEARIVDLRGGKRPSQEELRSPRIYLTDYVAVDVSATAIREAIEQGRPIDGLAPTNVAAYIRKYGLYRKL
jgi:nicotinate-nucleotide adenylyltransferase